MGKAGWAWGWLVGALLATASPAIAQEASVAWRPWAEVAAPPVAGGAVATRASGVTVWADPSSSTLARRVADHAEVALPRLADALGLPVAGDVHIVIAEDEVAFRELQPGPPPQWADATAWPGRSVVYLRHPRLRAGDAAPLEQVLEHELVHILVGRAFSPAAAPRWLQEGTAQVLSGEVGPELASRLARQALGGTTPSLASLTASFPDDPHRADAAYALSADVVLWLDGTYGAGTVRSVVQRVARGQSPRAALLDVTGHTLEELDLSWGSRLREFWPSLWASQQLEPALWALVSLGLLVTGARRRVGRGRTFDGWREEEAALARLTREVLMRRGPVA